MKIRYIFFDVFGTLVNVQYSLLQAFGTESKVKETLRAYGAVAHNYQDLNFEEALKDYLSPENYDKFINAMEFAPLWEDSYFIKNFKIPTVALSNATPRILCSINRRYGLFDYCFSSTDFGAFKPDPKVYLGACKSLGVEPSETLMCAAHNFDLRGARSVGMRTALIKRNGEDIYGQNDHFEFETNNFIELVEKINKCINY